MVDLRQPTLCLSFHGGIGAGNRNNIHAYDVEGSAIGKVLDKKSLPKKVDLRELRGFDLGPDGNLYAPAGMALDSDGSLFIASRLSNAVCRYRADDVLAFEGVVVQGLKDHPEFLVLVPTWLSHEFRAQFFSQLNQPRLYKNQAEPTPRVTMMARAIR